MISKKYFDMNYEMKPLCVSADLSQSSLQTALIALKFELTNTYKVVCGRYYLGQLPTIVQGVISLELELDDYLNDEWYVVCPTTKTLIYSGGA